MESAFITKLKKRWQYTSVCVGLDPDLDLLPSSLTQNFITAPGKLAQMLYQFNQSIIDSTADLVCAFKPNIAFYEAHGEAGLHALMKTIDYAKVSYPEVTLILDAKRGDIDSTNKGYVKAYFEQMGADAITVQPYLGKEAMQPFLDQKEKGIIVLAKTSNTGAGEFQDLLTGAEKMPIWSVIAKNVAQEWNSHGNCALVVGASYPHELEKIRQIVGEMPLLIPGIGAQGGDLLATVKAGKNTEGRGMIINSSRSIIYASSGDDFAKKARETTLRLRDDINRILEGCI